MEKHIVKRLLCGLLAFVLVLGYFPVPALAEEETSAPEETLSPETLPETLPETVPQTTPETLPETVPQTVPETVPETAPETVPEALLSDYTAEDVIPSKAMPLPAATCTITQKPASSPAATAR